MRHGVNPTGRTIGRRDTWAMAGAFVLLVVVGRVITPESSNAAPESPPLAPIPAITAPTSPSLPTSLGVLESRRETVEFLALEGEIRYRVRSANGELLADRLTSSELAAQFPHLSTSGATAAPLMLAEPDDSR